MFVSQVCDMISQAIYEEIVMTCWNDVFKAMSQETEKWEF